MARPRKSSLVLELSGAFDKNPARRRYPGLNSPPMCTEPDPSWSRELQEAFTSIAESVPEGGLRQMDRITVRNAAQLQVLLDKTDMDGPLYDRLDKAMWRYRKHLGLTPMYRARLYP